MRSRFLLLSIIVTAGYTAAASPAELLRAIQENTLDPSTCYRVRDLSFAREDVRVYLNEGYLIFTKPVEGRRTGALFSADVEGGDAEVIVLPPTRSERQSLARFTSSANLDEHLRAAFLLFPDGTADQLLAQIEREGAAKKSPEVGALLAPQWSPTVARIHGPMGLRLLQEVLSPAKPGAGFAFLALNGKTFGNFDIFVEPRGATRVEIRRGVEHDGKLSYEIWTSFATRKARMAGAQQPPPEYSIQSYRIDASLANDFRMTAKTSATLRVGPSPITTLGMILAKDMRLGSVLLDGKPLEFLRGDTEKGQLPTDDQESAILLFPPTPLASGSEHTLEFAHEGSVVKQAGDGVFFVADRESWYPRGGGGAAGSTYDITFRYPKRVTLALAGELVSDKTEGDWRTTRRRITVPVGATGFNLGDYEKVSTVASGVAIDVYGNRHLVESLKPPVDVLPQPPPPVRRGRGPQSQIGMTIPTMPTAPDPLGRLKAVAEDVSSAVNFYSTLFGPPALKTLAVAPIPATFGQGFPGLVYLSTFAYLDPRERPAVMRDARQQVFFSDMLAAHETAHQWWGAVTTVDRTEDAWLLDGLANYSALLWLEKKRGLKDALAVLQGYRDELLAETDGKKTVESAGPIVWGDRLLASETPEAWRAVTYGKGVWVLHMLRRRLGDERFLSMLAEFRKRYEFRVATTEGFKALVQEFRPRALGAEAIDTFFDNWVYATGVPTLKLTTKVTGVAPNISVTGTLEQSGVDEDFSVDVPLEVQFAKGPSQTIWVRTSTGEETFSEKLKQAPTKITLPDDMLLKH